MSVLGKQTQIIRVLSQPKTQNLKQKSETSEVSDSLLLSQDNPLQKYSM